jgi:hypothetical protein
VNARQIVEILPYFRGGRSRVFTSVLMQPGAYPHEYGVDLWVDFDAPSL